MTKDDIIRMAIEAGLHDEMWFGPHTPTNYEDCLPKIERFAALIAAAEREKVARWQIGSGYTTGHGETIEDLLVELEWQVRESERNGMVATASELGWALYGGDPFEDGVRDVAAIRARGQA